MVAKIADMGNSRIVDVQPGQLANTMTRGVPGTIVYMPPEAFELPPKYGPKLDMFSFGHLALFTATQQFPGDLLPSTYHTHVDSLHEMKLNGAAGTWRTLEQCLEGLMTWFSWSHSVWTILQIDDPQPQKQWRDFSTSALT